MSTPARTVDSRAAKSSGTLTPVSKPCRCGSPGLLATECESCRRRRLGIQRYALDSRTAAPAGARDPALAERVLETPGTRLDPATRTFMESRFGHDFSNVRVHAGPDANTSADVERAHAWTLGQHVVFAKDRYAPGTAEGRHLLAHELAHVVQQAGPAEGAPAAGDAEAAADRAARTAVRGQVAPPVGAHAPVIQRQDGDTSGLSPASLASRAELMCDLPALCRLHFAHRDIVAVERVRRAYRACRPGSSAATALNPCLVPDYASLAGAAGSGPTPGPTAAPTHPAPAGGASSGGLSLPSTTVRFSLGPVRTEIDLPSSVSLTLPIPFRGARNLEIRFEATTSGEFTLTMRINAARHVRVIIRARASATDRRGSAGVVVETTRTVCRATDEATARSQLTSAGERLRDAIRAAQNPPAPGPGEDPDMARLRRLADVVSGIVNVHQTVERVRAPCREVPFASFELGVQGPLGEQEPGHERERGAVPFLGGSATVRF
ncbi:MAG: DUF4157 domain-containing protein [Betaproteobacteria bacterium]|nr:DUF4157 domain-containing protein [Betaproteobacteria bacterium]